MSDTNNLKQKGKLTWQRLKESKQSLTPERRLKIIERLKKQKHKVGVNPDDWDKVHPNLLLVAEFDLELCEAIGLPVLYSSIIRPRIPNASVTDIHAQKRAYDRSILGWPKGMPEWIAELICDGLEIGAISKSDGKEKEALYEPAEFKGPKGEQTKWEHLHFQVRP